MTQKQIDETHDLNGSMWECEDCGKHFSQKCFTDRLGRKEWDKMMQGKIGSFDTERIFCPECYKDIIRDYPEKES